MTGSLFRSAACALSILLAGPAAAAPSPESVAGALAAAVAATGEGALSYDAVAGSGDAVTLTNVKIASLSQHSVVAIPSLIVTGVADRQPGGFTAAHIELDNGSTTRPDGTTTWVTAGFDDIVVPSADEVKARAKVRPFAKASMAGLSITGPTLAAPITIASAAVDVAPIVSGTPTSIQLSATGLNLKTSLLENSFASALVQMLDYQEVTANVTVDVSYDTDADTATVQQLVFDAAGIGKITVTAKASGLSVRGLTERSTSKDARAAARLDALKVRLDNAGVVERMLDMQAEMLGGTRDDVRSQLTDGAIPFALSFVRDATFRDQFQAAMETFLKDPKSLTVTMAPAQPVPLGEVLRTAGRRPGSLPDLLSPTVEVNTQP